MHERRCELNRAQSGVEGASDRELDEMPTHARRVSARAKQRPLRRWTQRLTPPAGGRGV